jgi:hypothetical protein
MVRSLAFTLGSVVGGGAAVDAAPGDPAEVVGELDVLELDEQPAAMSSTTMPAMIRRIPYPLCREVRERTAAAQA